MLDRGQIEGGMKRDKAQHVVESSDGRWSVRAFGASRSSKTFRRQADAVAYAKKLARKNASEIYVHNRDGTIRERDSFRDFGSALRPLPAT